MFNRLKAFFTGKPAAVSKVKGFKVAVEEVEPNCYKVTVTVTGKNPEYPAEDTPAVVYFSSSEEAYEKYKGSYSSTPFVGFEVVEEFNDGRNTMGYRRPPHHVVYVRGRCRDGTGIGVGRWVRQSERNSPAWQNPSQIFYG